MLPSCTEQQQNFRGPHEDRAKFRRGAAGRRGHATIGSCRGEWITATYIAAHTLWLTGWERTNLGPQLASHGARLVADPHPAENFFMRSDNITLARRGVVAQTVSSFGLHADYHQPRLIELPDLIDEVGVDGLRVAA
jgi:hypothetical protein